LPEEISLRVKIKDVEFKNPTVVPAGELCRDANAAISVIRQGVGGIVTKTITKEPLPVFRPFLAYVGVGLINSIAGSPYKPERWFKEELDRIVRAAKEEDCRVIVSVAGVSPEEVVDLATQAEKCGADLIEIPTYCPNIPDILEALEIPFQAPDLSDPSSSAKIVEEVKKSVSIPIIVKLSSVIHLFTEKWVKALDAAGADAICLADSLGPVLAIDIETGQPFLGGIRGFGGLTGPALKPLSLKLVFEAYHYTRVPIVGVGGISNWKDAVEYILAGASLIGIYSEAHLKGANVYKKVLDGLKEYMSRKGFKTIEDFRGLAVKRVKERKKKGLHRITDIKPPVIDENLCTGCKICERGCIYGAIKVDKAARVDPEKCYGCGLCATLCPQGAIKLTYYT